MSVNNPIAFTLLAEFDIEQGSKIIAQYPDNALVRATGTQCEEVADYMMPEGAHNSEYDWTVFLLNRTKTVKKDQLADDWELIEPGSDDKPHRANEATYEEIPPFPLLYCINLVHTRKDSSSKRGADMKALCIGCNHQFFHVYKPFLWSTLHSMYEQLQTANSVGEKMRIYHAVVLDLFQQASTFDIAPGLQIWSQYHELLSYGHNPFALFSVESSKPKRVWGAPVDSTPVQIHLPLHYKLDEVEDASISLLVNTFKEKTMVIYNAILLEKRIILLGHNLPSWVICRYVLSCCMLIHPLSGVLAERAYPFVQFGNDVFLQSYGLIINVILPFTNLSHTSNTFSKGYIVGVSNPFFKDKEVFWDVMCDLNSGEVRENRPMKILDSDKALIKKVMSGIQQGCDESWCRRQFQYYTQDIIDASLGKPVAYVEVSASRKESPFVNRIINWSQTRSYRRYMQEYSFRKSCISNVDIDAVVRKLRIVTAGTQPIDMEALLSELALLIQHITTDDQLKELFCALSRQSVDISDVLKKLKNPLPAAILFKLERMRGRLMTIVQGLLRNPNHKR